MRLDGNSTLHSLHYVFYSNCLRFFFLLRLLHIYRSHRNSKHKFYCIDEKNNNSIQYVFEHFTLEFRSLKTNWNWLRNLRAKNFCALFFVCFVNEMTFFFRRTRAIGIDRDRTTIIRKHLMISYF